MIHLRNQFISAQIKETGAELASLVLNKNQKEFLWSADPTVWGKSSPILFPIVGELKDGKYFFEGKEYHLPRHGLARNLVFDVEVQTQDSVTFLLKSTYETLKQYPFDFELRVVNRLIDNRLYNTYQIKNVDNKAIYASIGGHPAFAVPNENGLTYEDYELVFSEMEELESGVLSKNGLLTDQKFKVKLDQNILPLSKALFQNDALVLRNLKSKNVTLRSSKTFNQLTFNFEEFEFLGLWAAKNADFVCIEPWAGVCDLESHSQDFTQKTAINKIEVGETFERTWWVEIQ